jgi:hypothetical protein
MALVPAALNADKFWNNNLAITEPSAFAPVVDEDLDIQGLNQLNGHIHIAAVTSDVLVTVTVASEVTGGGTGTSELHIFAGASRRVTFSLEQDLFFRGSAADLLITFSGEGELVWQVAGDHRVIFGSRENTGGTIFVTNMSSQVSPNEVTFRRFPINGLGPVEANRNAFVEIGPRSIITFISDDTSGTNAFMRFDATNSVANRGRLILQLDDSAAFDIEGHLNNAAIGDGFGDITIANLNLTTVTGGRASVSVLNQFLDNSAFAGLLVINNNTVWRQLDANPWCEPVVSDTHVGFVLGANGTLNIASNSYLDYVGTVSNITVLPNIPSSILQGRPLTSVIKDRNPSAFIVDGSSSPIRPGEGTHAFIGLAESSAIYFRSGVGADGVAVPFVFDPVLGDTIVSFTINPEQQFTGESGYGSIVFDVEGPVDVQSDSPATPNDTALNVLSLFVTPTGGSVLIASTDVTFPLRTFARGTDGELLQYQKACFMVNNRLNMLGTNLQHTDSIHDVFEDNLLAQSEPTYIGGESFLLCPDSESRRPKIVLYNTDFLVQTNAALSGVDIFVPNGPIVDDEILPNISRIDLFYNGRCIDQGTGRFLILGSTVGGLASDFNTVINRDAHLDIFQDDAQVSPGVQQLFFSTSPNNSKVTEGIVSQDSIRGQFQIETIYLAWATNISIGTNDEVGTDLIDGTTFLLTTTPLAFIQGDFYSFETQGGLVNSPECSMTTGQGGIFVDKQGIFQIASDRRANMGVVVTKSRNGIIDLPKNQVFFDLRVGIAHWRINLSDPNQVEIVAEGQSLSDYTLDWKNITKDFCPTDTSIFVPYEPVNTPAACQAPPVTEQNLVNIPVIRGIVDQMQVKNSRLGDQVHLMIDGGLVRELVFLTGKASAVAPVGVIFIQNDGQLGLGTAHRNVDSDEAQVVLGINGVTLVPNGDAEVVLNEDTLINNVCHILAGPNFEPGNELFITSVVPRELRVKNEAVLDLTSFTDQAQRLTIGGEVTLVFEPGARLLLNGGTLKITENARVIFEPFFDAGAPAGTDLSSTDDFRVKISGSGRIQLSENSQMDIPRSAYVGIESAGLVTITDTEGIIQTETLVNCSVITSVTLFMEDAAKVFIGSDTDFGGSLQIGNVTNVDGGLVSFELIMNGLEALFDVNSQGFFGLGSGIVNKPNGAPNDWLIDRTFNVGRIATTLTQGTFKHNQIRSGTSPLAGLIAIGNGQQFGYVINNIDVDILGGGNIVQLTGNGPLSPTVDTTDGVITSSLSAGIICSQPMFRDTTKIGANALPAAATAAQLFNYLKMVNYNTQSTKLSTIAQNTVGTALTGYVDAGVITRQQDVSQILNGLGFADNRNSLDVGTVGLALGAINREPTYYEVNV